MKYSFIRLFFRLLIVLVSGTASAQCTFGIYAEVGDASACAVNDGTIDIAPTSGTPPFSYLWNTGATVPNLASLLSGTYTVTVTDGAGCIKRDTFFIGAPPTVTLSLVQGITCFGASNGILKASGFCGLRYSSGRYYQYRWYKLNGSAGVRLTAQIDSLATGLDTGTYYVVIADANSDSVRSSNITLTQPVRIIPAASITNVLCFGAGSGSVALSAVGGTGTYTYANGSGAYGSSGTFSGLVAGTYTFHIRDAAGCVRDTTITLTQGARIVPAAAVSAITCFGAPTGGVALSATGGSGALTYAAGSGAYGASGSFTGLPAGTYVFHVRDAAGCVQDTSISLAQPARIVPAAAVTNVLCFGDASGSVVIGASGGTGGYTFAIGSASYTASGTFAGLAAGSYTFHTRDASGCVQDTTINIVQAPRIVPAATVTNAACFGAASGSVVLAAGGGSGTYTYALGSGAYGSSGTFGGLASGTYLFHVKDASGCVRDTTLSIAQPARIVPAAVVTTISCNGGTNGSVTLSATGGSGAIEFSMGSGTYGTSGVFGGLSAGTYTFHIRDASACVRDTVITLTQPAVLALSLTASPVSCYGGSNGAVGSTIAGGTQPYSYRWSNGATTATLSNIVAGSYSLTLSDANGCNTSGTAVVTSPDSIRIPATLTAPSCFGFCDGRIVINPSGGTAPYSYSWSNGAIAKDQASLCAGTYDLALTDANGCVANTAITLLSPAAITVDAGPDRDLCLTGTITLRAQASAPAASFQWAGSTGVSSDSGALIVSKPGSYYVIASSGACQGRDTVIIGQVADDFDAEFVAATQAFRDSLYSIINISSPEPDSVLWSLPATPSVLEVSRSKYLAELIFRDTGVYVITMTGRKGQCEKVMENRVVVITGQGYTPIAGSTKRAHIKVFSIAPNPSSGRFNVHIELEEEGPVRLRLLALSSSGAADDRQDCGKKLYDFQYNLNLQSGQYLLLLETGRGSQSLKLTIR